MMPSARAAGSRPGQLGGKRRHAVDGERPLLAAAPPRQEGPQREPPQPLIPADPVLVEVAADGSAPSAPRTTPSSSHRARNVSRMTFGNRSHRRGASPAGANPRRPAGRSATPAAIRPLRGCGPRRARGGRARCGAARTRRRTPRARAADKSRPTRAERRRRSRRSIVRSRRTSDHLGGGGLERAARMGRRTSPGCRRPEPGRGRAARGPAPRVATWRAGSGAASRQPDPRSARGNRSQTNRCTA